MIVPSWKIRSSVILCLRCTGGITLSIVAYIQSSLRPVPNTFLSVRKNTERIPTKFAGGIITTTSRLSDYIFGEIGTRTTFFGEIGTEYERKFKSTSIGLAAMSNRCWRLANEFTDSLHRRWQIHDRIHNFTLIYRFHLQISYKYIKNFTAFSQS